MFLEFLYSRYNYRYNKIIIGCEKLYTLSFCSITFKEYNLDREYRLNLINLLLIHLFLPHLSLKQLNNEINNQFYLMFSNVPKRKTKPSDVSDVLR